MSDHVNAPDICIPILSRVGTDENFCYKDTYLCDLSPNDKPWDKHRRNADIVSDYYQRGGMTRHADRVRACAETLTFRRITDLKSGNQRFKLASAKFCRVRHCPICQWRRSLAWKGKAYRALPSVVADYPKGRWLFVTLTVKNCELKKLRETLDHVNQSFRRLTQLKEFPGIGWVKSIEITRGRDGQSAHPHLHCLILLNEDYYELPTDSTSFRPGFLSFHRGRLLESSAIYGD
jgi:plasmid rolling circle replication initiator protein Rep